MSAARILVTGGCGFIGAAVVRRLLADGAEVRVLDNLSRGSMRRLADVAADFEFVEGDVRDAGTVDRAAKGMDAVHHLSFVNGTAFFYSHPELVLDVGVKGIVNVLDAAIRHEVRELVLVSSSEVYQTPPVYPTPEDVPLSIPDPFNPRYSYGAGKIISEIMAINYGRKHFARTVIIRPHNVYGPDMGGEHVIPQFALRMAALQEAAPGKVRFPIQGSGAETRAFIYVDDFAEGYVRTLDGGDKAAIYHIGTMEERTMADLARVVARCYDRDIELVPGAPAAGETRRRCPDTTKLRALGFEPRVSLEEGVSRTVAWYRAHRELFVTSTGSQP